MENNEKNEIANIIEAFGKINQDIHGAFNAMSELMEKKHIFKERRKSEKGQYYDFKHMLNEDSNWYYLNNYGTINSKVIGFTFVIGVEYDEKDCEEDYEEFIAALQTNLRTPMLCIYGIYEPIDKDKFYLIDKYGNNYIDSVMGLIDDWKDFNKSKIEYKKLLNIKTSYKDGTGDYEGWYKTAKVKIIPIPDISSEKVAEEIIDDLFKMA